MPSVILIVVIAALCFSVGEGLRLTPFPLALEASDTQSNQASDQISNHKYGPLDVPAQHQKRNKRQAIPLDFLVTEHSCSIQTALHFAGTCEPVVVVSVLTRSQSFGRAPPFVS